MSRGYVGWVRLHWVEEGVHVHRWRAIAGGDTYPSCQTNMDAVAPRENESTRVVLPKGEFPVLAKPTPPEQPA